MVFLSHIAALTFSQCGDGSSESTARKEIRRDFSLYLSLPKHKQKPRCLVTKYVKENKDGERGREDKSETKHKLKQLHLVCISLWLLTK